MDARPVEHHGGLSWAVETTVLDGFGHVLGRDVLRPGEVRDRARNFEDAVVTARRNAEARDGEGQEPRAAFRERAPAANLTSAHARVEPGTGAGEAFGLPSSRGGHAGADHRRGLAPATRGELGVGHCGNFEMEIDPIEQRPG